MRSRKPYSLPLLASLLAVACSEDERQGNEGRQDDAAAPGGDVDSGIGVAPIDGGQSDDAGAADGGPDASPSAALPQDDEYYFCIGERLAVAASDGVLANDGPSARLARGARRSAKGRSVAVESNGSFTYQSTVSGDTNDTFSYLVRGADNALVEREARLSGLPLFPNTETRIVGFGENSYEFVGENGLLSPRGCARAGLVTIAEAALTTRQGHAVQVHADGRFTYEPAPSFWGADEFDADLQLGRGEATRKQTVRLVVSPKELNIGDLPGASSAVMLSERTGSAELAASFGTATGFSVSGGGDVNGDGFDDVVIGAIGQGSLVFGAERLETLNLEDLRNGSPRGVALRDLGNLKQPNWNELAEYLTASGDSDFNGDGLSDFAFGLHETPQNEGTLEIVLGLSRVHSAGGWMSLDGTRSAGGPGLAVVARNRGTAPQPLAETVVPVGDFNGDGLADFLVSAGPADVEGTAPEAYIIFGKSNDRAPLVGLPNGENGLRIRIRQGGIGALTAASAGDVDGDGRDDVLLRRQALKSPQSVQLIRGIVGSPGASIDATTTDVSFVSVGAAGQSAFGAALAGDFDFNGDGWPDLAFGDPEFRGGAGRAYVVFGSEKPYASEIPILRTGSDDIPGFVLIGEGSAATGATLAALGDVDGDGKDDLLVGAPGTGDHAVGQVYVVYGGSAKSLTVAALHEDWTKGFSLTGNPGDGLGTAVASAGDVNGDCFADWIVGAPRQGEFGAAYVLLGGNFTGAVDSVGRRKQIASEEDDEQVFAGGPGPNTLTSNSGSDVLLGGAGDDDFHVSGIEFGRIRGGRGLDTLHFAVQNGDIDLTTLPPLLVSGIEEIDLQGHGANILTLNRRLLQRLSSSLKHPGFNDSAPASAKRDFALRISGDPNDRVRFKDEIDTCPSSKLVTLDVVGAICETE